MWTELYGNPVSCLSYHNFSSGIWRTSSWSLLIRRIWRWDWLAACAYTTYMKKCERTTIPYTCPEHMHLAICHLI